MRNMNDILRQAQVMQNKLTKLQAELAEKTYEASSGGGIVKAEVTGKQELKKLVIDPAALEKNDMEMLEDLIIAAVNEALRIARETMEREMNAISGGINCPVCSDHERRASSTIAKPGRQTCKIAWPWSKISHAHCHYSSQMAGSRNQALWRGYCFPARYLEALQPLWRAVGNGSLPDLRRCQSRPDCAVRDTGMGQHVGP